MRRLSQRLTDFASSVVAQRGEEVHPGFESFNQKLFAAIDRPAAEALLPKYFKDTSTRIPDGVLRLIILYCFNFAAAYIDKIGKAFVARWRGGTGVHVATLRRNTYVLRGHNEDLALAGGDEIRVEHAGGELVGKFDWVQEGLAFSFSGKDALVAAELGECDVAVTLPPGDYPLRVECHAIKRLLEAPGGLRVFDLFSPYAAPACRLHPPVPQLGDSIPPAAAAAPQRPDAATRVGGGGVKAKAALELQCLGCMRRANAVPHDGVFPLALRCPQHSDLMLCSAPCAAEYILHHVSAASASCPRAAEGCGHQLPRATLGALLRATTPLPPGLDSVAVAAGAEARTPKGGGRRRCGAGGCCEHEAAVGSGAAHVPAACPSHGTFCPSCGARPAHFGEGGCEEYRKERDAWHAVMASDWLRAAADAVENEAARAQCRLCPTCGAENAATRQEARGRVGCACGKKFDFAAAKPVAPRPAAAVVLEMLGVTPTLAPLGEACAACGESAPTTFNGSLFSCANCPSALPLCPPCLLTRLGDPEGGWACRGHVFRRHTAPRFAPPASGSGVAAALLEAVARVGSARLTGEQLAAVRDFAGRVRDVPARLSPHGQPGHPPVVVCGPPGTGKTTTSTRAAFVAAAEASGRAPGRGGGMVLVCASTNEACDVFTAKLVDARAGMLASLRESRGGSAMFGSALAVARVCTARRPTDSASCREFVRARCGHLPVCLTEKDGEHGREMFVIPSVEALRNYAIVVCTPVIAGKLYLNGLKAEDVAAIVVDEAGALTIPTVLVALSLARLATSKARCQCGEVAPFVTPVLLVGDPRQLQPVVHLQGEMRMGLEVSPLESCTRCTLHHLTRSFRAGPAITKLWSDAFYGGVVTAERPDAAIGEGESWVKFEHCDGDERRDTTGSSFNPLQAERAAQLVCEYARNRRLLAIAAAERTPLRVFVVSPYTRHAEEVLGNLRTMLRRSGPRPPFTITTRGDARAAATGVEVEVATPERFQGREAHVVICCNVRTGEAFGHPIGFMDDPHRVCVIVSRAACVLHCLLNVGAFHAHGLAGRWRAIIDALPPASRVWFPAALGGVEGEPPPRGVAVVRKETSAQRRQRRARAAARATVAG